MSIIKASELAYCRVQVPDLDIAEQFLTDFGLVAAHQEDGRRFFRGTTTSPYCYIIEQGPTHFLGYAFHAKQPDDLQTLAQHFDTQIVEIDAPGGGKRVRLTDPNGYDVDIVYGIELAEPIEVKRQLNNTVAQPLLRAGELFEPKKDEPVPLRGLAHVVFGTPKARETTDWLKDTLGMIPSDEIVAGPDKDFVGAFIRVDEGDKYVDHHSVFVFQNETLGVHHLSFESQDIDAVLADHHFLKSLDKYEHVGGIGRHLLGSQVFDYWLDPHGYPHEHWSDTDRLNASTPTNVLDISYAIANQWGEGPTGAILEKMRP